jgi:hypothetical protein
MPGLNPPCHSSIERHNVSAACEPIIPNCERLGGRGGFRYGLAIRGTIMLKFLVSSFLMLVFTIPALAKPIDVYPVTCKDLWVAVKDTLENQSNYAVISEDEAGLRARFIVVGVLTQYTERVALIAKNGGCQANATILEVGSDNGDWRQFQHRLAKSLTKLQAAKPKPAASAAGQP